MKRSVTKSARMDPEAMCVRGLRYIVVGVMVFAGAFALSARAGTFDTFAANPNLSTEWTKYVYYNINYVTPTWNSTDGDLDLSKAAGNGITGLYRTGSTRTTNDCVTMTVKSLSRASGTWGFLGLMITAVQQQTYLSGAGDSYTLRMNALTSDTFQFMVTRTYADGISTFVLYTGPSQTFAGPYILEIGRIGDNYVFKVDSATLYTTGDVAGDFYSTAARDSMIYYQIAFGGDGIMTATVDDFGVVGETTVTLDGSVIGASIASNALTGSIVGTLGMINTNAAGFAYSLDPAGDTSHFAISTDKLVTAAPLAVGSYNVVVKGTNSTDGFWVTNSFTIAVTSPDVLPEAVQYWRFDDLSGATAANTITNGNTGTLVNSPTWITTGLEPKLATRTDTYRSRAALDFDSGATNDYVNGGNINLTSTNASGTVTVSMWVRPDSLTGDDRMFGQLSGALTQAGAVGEGQTAGVGGLWVYNGASLVLLANAGALSTGSWQHLAFVWNKGVVTAYVNGVKQLSAVASFHYATANGNFGIAGKFLGQYGTGFDGQMDDVAIFNVALNVGQIWSLASGAPAATPPPPRGTFIAFR